MEIGSGLKYVYMVNRFALDRNCDEVIRALRASSEACGRACEICENLSPAQAGRAAKEWREKPCILTAVGGDGSLNRLLNDTMGSGTILSFVPTGTGNDFYRSCLESMEDGIRETDVIRINDRFCINAACFGIDADIANDDRFIHSRVIPRPLRYHAGVLYYFLTWKKGRRLRVECGGEVVEGAFTTVVAANAQFYGSGYRICPGSLLNDGEMDVCLVDQLGKINMARTILSMKDAGHLKNPALRMMRARKLVVESPQPMAANVDGEKLPGSRFELELLPGACRIAFDRAFIRDFEGRLR